jgi:hypothetical protein
MDFWARLASAVVLSVTGGAGQAGDWQDGGLGDDCGEYRVVLVAAKLGSVEVHRLPVAGGRTTATATGPGGMRRGRHLHHSFSTNWGKDGDTHAQRCRDLWINTGKVAGPLSR